MFPPSTKDENGHQPLSLIDNYGLELLSSMKVISQNIINTHHTDEKPQLTILDTMIIPSVSHTISFFRLPIIELLDC